MNNLVAFFGTAILTALLLIIWGAVRIYRRLDTCLRLIASAAVTSECVLVKDADGLSDEERESINRLYGNQAAALIKLKESRP